MKKLIATFTLIALLNPITISATEPTEKEINETVLSITMAHMAVLMMTTFGKEITHATITNEDKKTVTTYKNFTAKEILESVENIERTSDKKTPLNCPFKTMSGTITTSNKEEDQLILMNLTLKGGNIKTFFLDNKVLKVNGKLYDSKKFQLIMDANNSKKEYPALNP